MVSVPESRGYPFRVKHFGIGWALFRFYCRIVARDWYRRPPFLPLPPSNYLRWRLHTAYGSERPQFATVFRDLWQFGGWLRDFPTAPAVDRRLHARRAGKSGAEGRWSGRQGSRSDRRGGVRRLGRIPIGSGETAAAPLTASKTPDLSENLISSTIRHVSAIHPHTQPAWSATRCAGPFASAFNRGLISNLPRHLPHLNQLHRALAARIAEIETQPHQRP